MANAYKVSIYSKEDNMVYLYDVAGGNAMEAEDNAIIEHESLDRGEIDYTTPIKVDIL